MFGVLISFCWVCVSVLTFCWFYYLNSCAYFTIVLVLSDWISSSSFFIWCLFLINENYLNIFVFQTESMFNRYKVALSLNALGALLVFMLCSESFSEALSFVFTFCFCQNIFAKVIFSVLCLIINQIRIEVVVKNLGVKKRLLKFSNTFRNLNMVERLLRNSA